MALKISVSIERDNVALIAKSLQRLTLDRVLVGVPGEKSDRQPDDEGGGPVTNAGLAYIHDNGSPEQNIPARPFMAPGVAAAREQIIGRMRAGALKALDGNADAVEKVQHSVGMIAMRAIQKRITDGPFAPLAPLTVKRRMARALKTGKLKFGPVILRPLIDTGQLRRAINYVIRRKGQS